MSLHVRMSGESFVAPWGVAGDSVVARDSGHRRRACAVEVVEGHSERVNRAQTNQKEHSRLIN
jgi:hypothetical protein